MHWILGGNQELAGVSGITMESDFVEAPSQMLEEWPRSQQGAGHFRAPLPANGLVRNILGCPQNMGAFQEWMVEEFADGKN